MLAATGRAIPMEVWVPWWKEYLEARKEHARIEGPAGGVEV